MSRTEQSYPTEIIIKNPDFEESKNLLIGSKLNPDIEVECVLSRTINGHKIQERSTTVSPSDYQYEDPNFVLHDLFNEFQGGKEGLDAEVIFRRRG